jgi:hypothetical protein
LRCHLGYLRQSPPSARFACRRIAIRTEATRRESSIQSDSSKSPKARILHELPVKSEQVNEFWNSEWPHKGSFMKEQPKVNTPW